MLNQGIESPVLRKLQNVDERNCRDTDKWKDIHAHGLKELML